MSKGELRSSGQAPARGSQPRIFISYRRSDSAAIVGHIYERLVARYTRESVFRDVDDIPLGWDFADRIKQELSGCDIVLVVIGPRWLGAGNDGNLRIQQDDDPVRIEVEAAVESGAAVIPVLVEDARMPKRGDLPDSLKGFESRNAAEIRTGKDFDHHVASLIASMDAILASRGKFVVNFPKWAARAAVYCAALALVTLGGLVAVALLGPGVSAGLALLGVAAASLGFAMACGFAGGNAAAKRRIPFPVCQKHPVAFSATTGVLTFLLLFVFGAFANPFLAIQPVDGSVQVAKRLRAEFWHARDNFESGKADFKQAEKLVDALKALDPQNGHASYFAGEIKRVRNSTLFTTKSCFKGWPAGKTESSRSLSAGLLLSSRSRGHVTRPGNRRRSQLGGLLQPRKRLLRAANGLDLSFARKRLLCARARANGARPPCAFEPCKGICRGSAQVSQAGRRRGI